MSCLFNILLNSEDHYGIYMIFRHYLYAFIICDWILENRSNCHTRPIPFYLAQPMATLEHYTYTVPLPGLAN